MPSPLTRRRFLHSTGLLATAWAASPRLLAQSVGANEKIAIGLIGCGGMGRNNLQSFMALDGVEVAGLCDVDETHLDEATADVVKAGRPAPQRWKDFRHLLDRKDIDAVIIATPDTMHALYRFSKWNLIWENRLNNGRGLDGGRQHGCEFIGANGSLIVDRTTYQWFPEKPDNPGPPPPVKGENTHWQNFLDCMKSRGKPRSDIESMAKTNIVCNLGNIAFQSGKTIRWNAGKQELVDRRDAQGCISYQRNYRAP